VPRHADEADAALVAEPLEGLAGTVLAAQLLELPQPAEEVVLVQVEVVGLQAAQALLEQRHGAVVGVVVALGGQKDLAAALAHHGADVQFAGPVAVQGGRVHIVDAQIQRPVHDGDGLLVAVVPGDGEQSPQAVDGDLAAGLAQRPPGDGPGRRFGAHGVPSLVPCRPGAAAASGSGSPTAPW